MEPLSDSERYLPSQMITLQVGDQRFTTSPRSLVMESKYFSALLSEEIDPPQSDGSFFVDADPIIFVHILRYLCRGVLPLFYDKLKGHNYAMYATLLKEAKFFQIVRLEEWIRRKEYLNAVTIKYSAFECSDLSKLSETTGSRVEVEYHPMWTMRKVYVCLRGIGVHRGDPNACGKLCVRARGDDEDKYVDEWE